MKTKKQMKTIVADLLNNNDMGLSEILKVLVKQKLTETEAYQIIKMLNFFSHDYLNNTTDWFIGPKEPPLKSQYSTKGLVYERYVMLGITFEDIANSKGYVANEHSENHKDMMFFAATNHSWAHNRPASNQRPFRIITKHSKKDNYS